MRNQSHKRARRGATTLQMLVILVPVLFGFMGFAVDLGRLYMIRGELKTAADAMALAAAQQLIGTADADARATDAIEVARTNRYDYGGMPVGETTGNFTSTVESAFAGDLATATGQDGAIPVDTTQNRYARVTVTADAPLVFFRLFAIAQEGRTQVMTRSVAGVSAPLCTACGIEPIVISALNPDEPEHFGFTQDLPYRLGSVCTGPNQPQSLPGEPPRVPYLLLDRFTNATNGPEAAAVRAGAGGLQSTLGCVRSSFLTQTEEAALFVQPVACAPPGNVAPPFPTASNFVCGLSSRLFDGGAAGCEERVSQYAPGFPPDTFLEAIEEYSGYTGNTRRIITVAIVRESFANGAVPPSVEVLGFRQFLLDINLVPTDQNYRFNALYLGYPMPLRQGSISSAADENGNICSISSGPGKVVLHQ